MSTNFDFIPHGEEWQSLRQEVLRAEQRVYEDPGSACLKARVAVEFVVSYLYEHELAAQDRGSLFQNVDARAFKSWVRTRDSALYDAFHQIRQSGNEGAHYQEREVRVSEALQTVRALHRVMWWFVQRYAPAHAVGEKPQFAEPEEAEERESEQPANDPEARARELEEWSTSRLAGVIKDEPASAIDVEIATAILLNRIHALNNDLFTILR